MLYERMCVWDSCVFECVCSTQYAGYYIHYTENTELYIIYNIHIQLYTHKYCIFTDICAYVYT